MVRKFKLIMTALIVNCLLLITLYYLALRFIVGGVTGGVGNWSFHYRSLLFWSINRFELNCTYTYQLDYFCRVPRIAEPA